MSNAQVLCFASSRSCTHVLIDHQHRNMTSSSEMDAVEREGDFGKGIPSIVTRISPDYQ